MECVTLDGVREHQAALQAIADANNGIRTSGSPGYDASVDYVVDRFTAAGYDVTVQPFQHHASISLGSSILEQVAPTPTSYTENIDFKVMTESDAGDVTALVTAIDLDLGLNNASTSGCEASDFIGFPVGNIALMQRGLCFFSEKAENAAAAGASGAIIFNQGNTAARMDVIDATLNLAYTGGIPVMFASYGRGVEWAGTPGLSLHMDTSVIRGDVTSYNVFGETTTGEIDNVIMAGAHLDSVDSGPGIQDNGSGSAALLEVAEQMANVNPVNKVRFAWWGSEEFGLLGSRHYVSNLTAQELDDIALYLNFDMIGSPNYVFMIYDGDNSDGVGAGPGPVGSAEIEALFESYYTLVGEPFKGTDFSGHSDYGPFIAAGIPSGGLFTGAGGIKTTTEAAIWGGTAGDQHDPCYHLACDTFANVSFNALDVNSDGVAFAILKYAMGIDALTEENVNDKLSLVGSPITSFDAGTLIFTLESTFENTSTDDILSPFFDLSILEGDACTCSVIGFGGVGADIPIDVGDGTLSPGEQFTQTFDIQLTTRDVFTFFVDVFGFLP